MTARLSSDFDGSDISRWLRCPECGESDTVNASFSNGRFAVWCDADGCHATASKLLGVHRGFPRPYRGGRD